MISQVFPPDELVMITKAIAFLVQANGDDAVEQAIPGLSRLAESYTDQQIQFFLINSMGLQDRDNVQAEMERSAWICPF